MKIFFLFFLFFSHALFAQNALSENELKKLIGHMIVTGFDDAQINADSKIIQDINKYELGGVILFDIFYHDRSKNKNIISPKQVQELTSSLQTLSKRKILISIDQEGGKVARLKPKYGFLEIPSAKQIALSLEQEAKTTYNNMAKMLQENGFNTNFAPVVDLAINPKNKVIVGLERSFSKDPEIVSEYASLLIDSQKKHNIISVLKHFPGHGSSLGDSHLGFVDISDTWDAIELQPYKTLIKQNKIDMIMTAHVFNRKLDSTYPATLSKNVNTKLLRKQLGYTGVIISDDLQMQAITKHYSLKETVTLAINAGVDMLLFGNQLAQQDIDELIETIYKQVKNRVIPLKRIQESNMRIEKLYE